MADSTTTNYGYTMPEVGASQDTWGDKLNANWEEVDADLKVAADLAAAALPKSGGTMSGELTSEGDTGSVTIGTLGGGALIAARDTYPTLRVNSSGIGLFVDSAGATSANLFRVTEPTGEFALNVALDGSVKARRLEVYETIECSAQLTVKNSSTPYVNLVETTSNTRWTFVVDGKQLKLQLRDAAGAFVANRYWFDDTNGLASANSVVNRAAGDARYARADSSAGSVGTYAMLRYTGGSDREPGQTVTTSGGNLAYSNADASSTNDLPNGQVWRLMGETVFGGAGGPGNVSLWRRES